MKSKIPHGQFVLTLKFADIEKKKRRVNMMSMEKIKEVWECVTEGTVEVSKREVLLGIGFCLTAGVLVGIIASPFTRGISVGSYNGNNNSGDSLANKKENKKDNCKDEQKDEQKDNHKDHQPGCCKKGRDKK